MAKATEIKWDYDYGDVFEQIKELDCKEAAKILGIPANSYVNMTTLERESYVYDAYHHSPGAFDELLNLPSEVVIPKELSEDEDITNWLSDEYGFCINGYTLV